MITNESSSLTFEMTPENEYQDSRVIDIGTSEETITIISDVANPGPLFVRNFDTTNFFELGYAAANYPHKIPAGHAYVIPLNAATTTLYVKADTASVLASFKIRSQV